MLWLSRFRIGAPLKASSLIFGQLFIIGAELIACWIA